MKHLKLFENWTYKKVLDKFKIDEELNKIIAKYIYWKSNNSKTQLSNIIVTGISDIGELWVNYDYIVDNINFSHSIKIDNSDEFNKFAENPDLFIEKDKYNL